MSDYPEHEKLLQVCDITQRIGEFLEWEKDKGRELCSMLGSYWHPLHTDILDVLYEYAGIDRQKLEAEKRQMIAILRHANGLDN